MLLHDRAVNRGVELGPYPLEALPRAAPQTATVAANSKALRFTQPHGGSSPLARTAQRYTELFLECMNTTPAPRGEVTEDLIKRARELKGAAYYLDAAHAGVCMLQDTQADHTHALVILTAFGRPVETDNLASGWLEDAQSDLALMRAVEIGVALTGFIHALGFCATLHRPGGNAVNLEQLALLSGVAQPSPDGAVSPFIGDRFAIVAITTDYALACDAPLAEDARLSHWALWRGVNGAVSGREHKRLSKRASHLSRYPMERVRRVERPTTHIFADEVPRVSKRAEFFQRARMGDLGAKAQQEVKRFAFKHPLTDGMMYPLRAMVPHQDGPTADVKDQCLDAQANTRAIKSLSYHLGADLTGICGIPDYAWYSHDGAGKRIEPYHKYAVVMLIDQGYDTMEGASGDDWISGCQSMRGYIRGAEIAGIMAELLRKLGHSARSQTNADSHVLQIPLVLLAGLGELSRIGELVLNPYVGPRFKSVVLTTNLPLVPDQPIDFGLQRFCSNCLKCARECPVNAIPFGDKVVYNGYEIWKPDVERCTRYRVTNPKGSACGRCMKTCPLNKVVTADGAIVHRLGTWLGINVRWLKPLLAPIAVYLDDKIGYGRRNPVKRWWSDLEMVGGRAIKAKATNERDLDLAADVSGKKSPVGYYHAADMPPPNSQHPHPVSHKQAIARAANIETVGAALARRKRGEPPPSHYIAVAELRDDAQEPPHA